MEVQKNFQESFWGKYAAYIIELCVLFVFLVVGLFLYLDYSHKKMLQENIVSEEVLKQVDEGLRDNLNLVELKKQKDLGREGKTVLSENDLQKIEAEKEKEIAKYEAEKLKFTEEKLFDFLSMEKQPKLLDNLIGELVIKNNSTSTAEETCEGSDLLEKDECKKSLFVGCAEALYLKFAIVNECVQFEKEDYVNYIKAKRELMKNLEDGKEGEVSLDTKVGVVVPSAFTLSREELKNTIDSSVLNNDFSKSDFTQVSNESEVLTFKEIEKELKQDEEERLREEFATKKLEQELIKKGEEDKKLANRKVLNSLLTSLTGVIVHYGGWVQGWATVFAVNGGRPEAGFKMYKTTAFGYNPYKHNNCLISLPYKTVDKFFGTNLNYCVRNGLLSCINADKQKVKGKPIEVVMIKNGKRGVYPLGDLGPAEWTGNALDLNGCAARELGASGKDQVRFRVAK